MDVLLHVCCGVCAAAVVERLTAEGYRIHGFFYNPNIHPGEEYELRLTAARAVARRLDFPLDAGSYTPDEWSKMVQGLENEPEGGRRCAICYRLRLEKTFEAMRARGIDYFASTLTISPHKSSAVINRLGAAIGGESFLARDFKKKGGFQRSNELARDFHLYRQHYCGCRYSMKAA